MFRIQVRYNGRWKWGINDYPTIEAAEKRVEELKKVGIKARIKPAAELFA